MQSFESHNTRPHAANLRKGRFSIKGQIYVITTVTKNRTHVFNDFDAARSLIQVIKGHDRAGFTETLCFVVMPDHLHWMMQLKGKKNLGETVRALKSIASRKIGKPTFQKGYYDHAIRTDEDIIGMARYIVANPLRAGFVTNLNDYSHWDAVWL